MSLNQSKSKVEGLHLTYLTGFMSIHSFTNVSKKLSSKSYRPNLCFRNVKKAPAAARQ